MALGMITSYVGKSIATDQFTAEKSTLSYARVLVKVDVVKPLVKMVTFQLPNGEVENQEVIFENEPA